MNKTSGLGLLTLALALVIGFSADAFARPQHHWRDMELDSAQRKELRQLQRDMEDKCLEMDELFEQSSVDADKARALQKEMQDIRGKIGAFWLERALEYKQAYPEWTPRFGGPGMMGMGGPGHGMHGYWDDDDRGPRQRGPEGPRPPAPRE